MKKCLFKAVVILAVIACAGCVGKATPSPAWSATATPTAAQTTAVPTENLSTATFTPAVTSSATQTQAPTATATVTQSTDRHPLTKSDPLYRDVSGKTMDMFYVSAQGDDSNDGTKGKPFKTLDRAQKAVRALLKRMTGNIYVNICPGVHYMQNTLKLTAEDKPSGSYRVIYRGPVDLTATLSAGVPVKGWQAAPEAGAGVYKAKLQGVTGMRQFYVNGERRVRARYVPLENTPYGKWNRLFNYYHTATPANVNGTDYDAHKPYAGVPDSVKYGIVVRTQDIPKLKLNNIDRVELVLFRDWITDHLKVKGIYKVTESMSVIGLEDGPAQVVMTSFAPFKRTQQPYFLENALEFLDEGGEWYFNNDTSTVYYKPKQGEDINKISAIAPVGATPLIKLEGASPKDKLSGYTVLNLRFMYTTWLWPDTYSAPDTQANAMFTRLKADGPNIFSRPESALSAQSTEGLIIERCVFENLGGSGIRIGDGCRNTTVKGNVVRNTAGIGIEVPSALNFNMRAEKTYITNNLVEHYGCDYGGATGIFTMYTQETYIEHNEVRYGAYTGISMGWGWDNARTGMGNNHIRYNHVHHVMQLLFDGAGIYTLGYQPGSDIKYNYIHDIHWSPYVVYFDNVPLAHPQARSSIFGIYLDAMSGGITAKENYFARFDNMYNLVWNRYPVSEHTDGSTGSNELSSTDDVSVKNNAGIEQAYRDIYGY